MERERLTETDVAMLAIELAGIFNEHNVAEGVRIYFNNMCMTGSSLQDIKKDEKGSTYTEFANDDLITVIFDGTPLYKVLNHELYEPWSKIDTSVIKDMRKLFKKYGVYYEYGDFWNFSVYEEPLEKEKPKTIKLKF